MHHDRMAYEKSKAASSSAAFFISNATNGARSTSILPTGIVGVLDKVRTPIQLRTLVDTCAQSSYISETAVQTLGLRKYNTKVEVVAIGGVVAATVEYLVRIILKLKDDTFVMTKALVVPQVTVNLPTAPIHTNWPKEVMEELSDTSFKKPEAIHLLLGAPVWPFLVKPGIKIMDGCVLQESKIGTLVTGSTSGSGPNSIVSSYVTLNELQSALTKAYNEKKSHLPVEDNLAVAVEAAAPTTSRPPPSDGTKATVVFTTLDELESEVRTFFDMPLRDEPDAASDADYCEKVYREQHSR